MNTLLKITKFQLYESRGPISIFYGVILGIITLTILITRTGANSEISGLGFSPVVFIFILGLNCFTSTFRFTQANNISRRRFYGANVLALMSIALFMASFDLCLGNVASLLIPYKGLFLGNYGRTSLIAELIWSFTLAAFAAHLGWMISMIYYRSTKIQKILVSVSPVFLLIIGIYVNRYTAGAFANSMLQFFRFALGFSTDPNPYTAALSFVISTVITAGFCFLLVRDIPVKD